MNDRPRLTVLSGPTAVGNAVNSIGYADASQAGDLGVAAIGVGDDFVTPEPEAAAKIFEVSPRVEGRAETSSGDPGSVTMTMRSIGSIPAAVKAAAKTRLWLSVSTVEPDFDDKTTTVRSSGPSSAACTWSGCVESSTTR